MKVVITNAASDAGSAAARSLCLAGYEVHGLDARHVPRLMASRYLAGCDCIDEYEPSSLEDAVLRFVDRIGADVFLPLFTRGAVMCVRRRREFASLCRTIVPDAEAFMAAYDKRLCMQSCSALGIPCAGNLTRDDAAALLASDSRSVVVKPAFDVTGAQGLRHVTDISELDAAIHLCTTGNGSPVIQEYIPGADDALRMVTVVYGGSGRLVGAFTSRKQRQWPTGGGVTALGISTRDDALLDLVRPFFDHWRWRGPAEVELKQDARDGTCKVLEINPRFPGHLRHASLCGVEPAVLAVRAALGADQPVTDRLSTYREGVTYLAPAVFVKSVAHDARAHGWRRAITKACSEASAAGPMLRALLADPLPIIARSCVPRPPRWPAPFTHGSRETEP